MIVDRNAKRDQLAALVAGRSEPGRTDELVAISEGIDSNPICMATVTIVGARPGPRIWLQAQTHGDEQNPTEAILRVIREIDPQKLSGVLVVAPAMHSSAVREFRRESSLDTGKNGNRVWGVDWTSTGHTKVFSYIWMHHVSELIVAFKPDLVIDMHDGGIPLRIMSHALYMDRQDALSEVAKKLCWSSGMQIVWEMQGGRFNGSINYHMHQLGFPSVMLEAGGTGQVVDVDIEEMAFGLRNVLKGMGMLEGAQIARKDEVMRMTGAHWVRAGRAGILYRRKELGDFVSKGDLIAEISNMFGHIVEQIVAPVDGIVFGQRYLAVANVGDYVANVGHVKR
jgi:predicted deacylase